MFKKFIFVALFLTCCSLLFALPPEGDNQIPFNRQGRTVDNLGLFDANYILMFVTNHGNFGRDLSGYFAHDRGTWYPFSGDTSDYHTGSVADYSPLYSAGIWLGGKVNGETRVSISEYSSEYVPGPMANGTYQQPNPAFHVYKLYNDSLGNNPNADYINWPVDQGAPVDGNGNPKMTGDQMLWSVYNDADPDQHTNIESSPLGIEVQQTVFGYPQLYADTNWIPAQSLEISQDGNSTTTVTAELVNPNDITGHTYLVTVEIDEALGPVWHLIDETLGINKLENQTNFSGDDNYEIIDGYRVKVISTEGSFLGFSSFEVVANADGPVDPPEAAAAPWQGFETPTGVDPEGNPTEGQQVGAGKWLFHVYDNGGTNDGGTQGSYEAFVNHCLYSSSSHEVGKYDFEMRFTGSYDNPGVGGSYAVNRNSYPYPLQILWVPFELWRTGIDTPDDFSDDVRLTPWIFEYNQNNFYDLDNWGDFNNGNGRYEHSVSDGNDDPYTDMFYWILPVDDSPGEAGYLADVDSFDLVNMTIGSYAFDGKYLLRRTVLVNWDGGSQPPFNQDLPEQGTVFRIRTSKSISEDSFHFTQTIEPVVNTNPDGNSLYIKYKLFNKGQNNISDMYIALWSDPDLGYGIDDLVGCDTLSDIFYCYNDPASYDRDYGANPPVIGFKLLHGPVVPGLYSDTAIFDDNIIPGYKNLDMKSFFKYINGTDPDSPVEAYNYMQGLDRNGDPYIYNGQELHYMLSGDPVTGVGDIDYASSDRRMMASFGPLDMNPGDSQYVLVKMAVSYGEVGIHPINKVKDILNTPMPQGPPALKTEINPNPQYEFMKKTIEPMTGTVTFGYDALGAVGKMFDYSSITLNTDIPIDSFTISSSVPGFVGPVVILYYPVREFLLPFGTLYDVTEADYTIAGQYTDGEPFNHTGKVTLIGHISGDFNLDGTLDIGDLVAWVDFSFNDGPPPQEIQVLDMNHSGEVDITDLIMFVQYMFPEQ